MPSRRSLLLAGLVLVVLVGLASGGCSNRLGEAKRMDNQGNVKSAIAIYKEILKQQPNNVVALAGLGADLFDSQQYDEALTVEEKTVKLDSGDAATRVELGFNYLNHQGRPSDAVRILSEAAKLDRSAKVTCFLAQAQEANNDRAGAEKSLRQAIAKEPTYAYSYKLLVALLKKDGRSSEATQVNDGAAAHGIKL